MYDIWLTICELAIIRYFDFIWKRPLGPPKLSIRLKYITFITLLTRWPQKLWSPTPQLQATNTKGKNSPSKIFLYELPHWEKSFYMNSLFTIRFQLYKCQ